MEARWLAYIGSGLLAALSLAPSTFLTAPRQTPPAAPSATAAVEAPIDVLVDVERQTARLRRHLEDAPTPRVPGRNPFRYAARPVQVRETGGQPRSGHAVTPVPDPDQVAQETVPPRPQLRLVGMAEQAEGDSTVRTAVIAAFGDVYLVRVGDRLGERYEVAAVGADTVEVLDTLTQQVFSLRLNR